MHNASTFGSSAGAKPRNEEIYRPVPRGSVSLVAAVRSILNGEAAEYAAENNARLELYTNGEPEITISPLSVEPYLLYIDDVTNEGDRGYWLNLALMDYYGKDKITVSGPEE